MSFAAFSKLMVFFVVMVRKQRAGCKKWGKDRCLCKTPTKNVKNSDKEIVKKAVK